MKQKSRLPIPSHRRSLASAFMATAFLAGASMLGAGPPSTGAVTAGGACQPGWIPTFGRFPGVTRAIGALATFDDGSGPALYAAGHTLFSAGGVPVSGIAKWDGTSWSPLASDVDFGSQSIVLTVFDDGSGPALYMGSHFRRVDGVEAMNIAKWDGVAWSAVGTGTDQTVEAMAVFDDGSGPALYVGGEFRNAGGVPVNLLAKWDGAVWSSVGGGITGTNHRNVESLAVFDDGTGPSLYVGGTFDTAGGVPANNIAKWDGQTWSALGGGVTVSSQSNFIPSVRTLAVFDDGTGPALYAGGSFVFADGHVVNNIARWDGTAWLEVGGGVTGAAFPSVWTLAAFDDGTGAALYTTGFFTNAGAATAPGFARWDGKTWSEVPGSPEGGRFGSTFLQALAVFDDGSGPALYVGGDFDHAGGNPAINIVRWNGAAWSPLFDGLNDMVSALTVFNDGSGPAVFAGGSFTGVSSQTLLRIGKWDGAQWSPLGSGVTAGVISSHGTTFPPAVSALTVFDDGFGNALYAGGTFSVIGGEAALNIAKWNGSSWFRLGSGMTGGTHSLLGPLPGVFALESFNDGSGPALFAGGLFTEAGGVPAAAIAKWDGARWSALGSGLGPPQFGGLAKAIAVFDDGSGPALYVGGRFTMAGGIAANFIARWDGASWSSVGSGMDRDVNTLKVFDDGSGAALYAGGEFRTAGGAEVNHIAKWDGQAWSSVGGGVTGNIFASVQTMTVFDDGSEPALFVGGSFASAGGVEAHGLAKWNGTMWIPLQQGVNRGFFGVEAMIGLDSRPRPALFAGGDFVESPAGDAFLAKMEVCRRPLPDFNGDGVVNAADLSVVLVNWGPCSGSCTADVTGDGIVDGVDLANVLNAWSTP